MPSSCAFGGFCATVWWFSLLRLFVGSICILGLLGASFGTTAMVFCGGALFGGGFFELGLRGLV